MKFKNNSDLIVTGEIENKQVTISEKDSDFIVAAISSMLYTNPIQSFSREIVSNAYDSHIEAKQKNPIVITLGENLEDNFFCTIRDFGTGISPENFDLYYRKVGASTKRETNEQIGMYGFGRFSALAVADFVTIKSFYEGTVTEYLMYKEGVKIYVNETSKKITDEPNGLEVGVFLGSKYKNKELFAREVLEPLYYFEDVYVENKFKNNGAKSIIEDFNNNKIKHYKNFSISRRGNPGNENILLGKVLYEVNYEIGKEIRSIFAKNKISNHFFDLRFEIGELEVTPNRENIIDNQNNNDKIRTKTRAAVKEFLELAKDQMNTVETNLHSWYKKNENYYSDIFLEGNTFGRMGSIQIETEKCNFSFHNKDISNTDKTLQILRSFYRDKKLFRVVKDSSLSQLSYNEFIKNKCVLYPYKKVKPNSYIGGYKYPAAILKYSNSQLYKQFVLEAKDWNTVNQKYTYNKAYKSLFKCVLEDISKLPVLDEKEIIPFPSLPRKARTKKVKTTQEQIDFIPISNVYNFSRKLTTVTLKDFIADFKSKTIVYTSKFTKEEFSIFEQFKYNSNQILLKLNDKDLPKLSMLKNLIPVKEFCSYKNKFVQRMATIEYLYNEDDAHSSTFDFLEKDIIDHFVKEEEYKKLQKAKHLYIQRKTKLDIEFRKEMLEAKARRLLDYTYIEQFRKVNKVRKTIGKYLQSFYYNKTGMYMLLFFLLKNKIVRPIYSEYKKLQGEVTKNK